MTTETHPTTETNTQSGNQILIWMGVAIVVLLVVYVLM
jgi:hypothetical protein